MPETEIYLYRSSRGEVPFQDWLDELEETEPRAYEKCLERVLSLARDGNQLRRPVADYLRDGIYELRARVGNVHYRPLYFFCGKGKAVISHGTNKTAAKVDSNEIEIAILRHKEVQKDFKKHTAEWEIDDG